MGSHTLILIQKTAKVTSRTFYDYESIQKAAEGIIQIFEDDLKARNRSPSVKYSEDDLYKYIEGWQDLVSLVREEVSAGVYAYNCKDVEWLKRHLRQILLRKVSQATAAGAGGAAGGNAPNTLAYRMQQHAAGEGGSGGRRSGGPGGRRSGGGAKDGSNDGGAVFKAASAARGAPKTELMTKGFADRYNIRAASTDSGDGGRDRPFARDRNGPAVAGGGGSDLSRRLGKPRRKN